MERHLQITGCTMLFLNIDNRKMSKSLGNFRTVREISEQYDLQVLSFLYAERTL